MKTLFKINYFKNRAYYEEFVVADNKDQVEANFPLDVNWEVVQENIPIF